MKIEVEISDWNAQPKMLQLTVRTPVFGSYATHTFYRRKANYGQYGTGQCQWGWYCNASDGALPEQAELAPLLNKLVLAHSAVNDLAYLYDIHA